MSVYRRGDSWYINITLGGRRLNKKLPAASKKEALAQQEELKTKYRLKQYRLEDLDDAPFDILFKALADSYFSHCAAVKGRRTYLVEKNYFDNHIAAAFGTVRLGSFTSALIMQYRDDRKAQRYSNRTVNILVGIVRKIINHACAADRRVKKLWLALDITWPKALKEASRQHAFFTFQEFDALYPKVKDKITGKRVIVTRYTGLRPAEAAYLEWDNDVNFSARTIKVQSKHIPGGLWSVKDWEERTIPLSPEAYDALKELYEDRQTRLKRDQRRSEPWVFSTAELPVVDIDKSLATAAKEAGIKKKVSPNMLRHTFATLQLAAGADIRSIQKLMGHADIRTTMKYLDAIDENLIKAVHAHQSREHRDKPATSASRKLRKKKGK